MKDCIAKNTWGLSRWLSDKESTCQAGDAGSIPRLGISSGEGNGNPFQYSCLENPMDRGAWWAIVHGVTKIWTWLNTHTHTPHSRLSLSFSFLEAAIITNVGLPLLKNLAVCVGPTYSYYRYITYLFIQNILYEALYKYMSSSLIFFSVLVCF